MRLSDAPAKLVEAWATGDSSKTNPIPVPSQQGITPGAASWVDGFPPLCAEALADGGVPPSKADMNGGLYQMSAVDVWMSAGGGFPYDATFSTAIGGYPKGARVLMASGNGYWVSTTDNNVTDPDTGGAGWAADDSNALTALTGDVTATGPGSSAATLAASGVTAGNYPLANITVDAKGRVTAAVNGALSSTQAALGVGRSLGTVYANGSGKVMIVTVTCSSDDGSYTTAFSDSSSNPTTAVSQMAVLGGQAKAIPQTFCVLPGNNYKVVAGGDGAILCWTEWTIG